MNSIIVIDNHSSIFQFGRTVKLFISFLANVNLGKYNQQNKFLFSEKFVNATTKGLQLPLTRRRGKTKMIL